MENRPDLKDTIGKLKDTIGKRFLRFEKPQSPILKAVGRFIFDSLFGCNYITISNIVGASKDGPPLYLRSGRPLCTLMKARQARRAGKEHRQGNSALYFLIKPAKITKT